MKASKVKNQYTSESGRERYLLNKLKFVSIGFITIKFNGNYGVANNGDVASYFTGRILKPNKINSGYFVVNLKNEGKQRNHLVHRLVAKHFLDDKELETVNHIDGNKTNNNVYNLEWATYKGNEQDKRIRINRSGHGTSNPMSSLDDIQVLTLRSLQLENRTKKEKEYLHKQLKDIYGVTQGTIRNVITGRTYKNIPIIFGE